MYIYISPGRHNNRSMNKFVVIFSRLFLAAASLSLLIATLVLTNLEVNDGREVEFRRVTLSLNSVHCVWLLYRLAVLIRSALKERIRCQMNWERNWWLGDFTLVLMTASSLSSGFRPGIVGESTVLFGVTMVVMLLWIFSQAFILFGKGHDDRHEEDLPNGNFRRGDVEEDISMISFRHDNNNNNNVGYSQGYPISEEALTEARKKLRPSTQTVDSVFRGFEIPRGEVSTDFNVAAATKSGVKINSVSTVESYEVFIIKSESEKLEEINDDGEALLNGEKMLDCENEAEEDLRNNSFHTVKSLDSFLCNNNAQTAVIINAQARFKSF